MSDTPTPESAPSDAPTPDRAPPGRAQPDDITLIAWERLPPGFAETVRTIPEAPATPRPSATIVLVRDGAGGRGDPEVLLLRRVRSAGFVPGAWVFPGGRVDAADRTPEAIARWTPAGAPDRLADRLGLADPVEAAGYVNAALREALEETGVPVALTPRPDTRALSAVRTRLLDDALDWAATLVALDAHIDAASLAWIAHWVTPVQEPRRYDTRFFLARVERDLPLELATEEMSDGRWIGVDAALAAHAEGALPMVFPTIRTLEGLRGFASADAMLEHARSVEVPRILPRLVAEAEGVRMVID
ncbi:MAG: NUDIX domain-containing protein [Longimicrobiales bacterium]|nr:NUDIX domain-containing protein [Longimicrobiales bacterium]